jgi:hypothetical protein
MIKIVNNGYNLNLDKILRKNDLQNYGHLCDYCGEVFNANIVISKNRRNLLKCPNCYSLYAIVYNELNQFCYLEFVHSPYYFLPLNDKKDKVA